MFLPVPLIGQGHIFILKPVKSHIQFQISSNRDMPALKLCDHISLLKSGFLGRRPFLNLKDRRGIITDNTGNDHGKNEGQNKIKDRPCRYHRDPCPNRSPVKRSLAVVIIILSHHHTGTSDGKQL